MELATLPTVVTLVPDDKGVHESTLRAFHVLRKVVDYLRRGVPPVVVLELLAELDTLAVFVERIQQAEALRASIVPVGPPQNGSGSVS